MINNTATSITVRGVTFNKTSIAEGIQSQNTASENRGILANACAVQMVAFNNPNWLTDLFNTTKSLTLKSGELSKDGKELKDYILAHAPSVKIELVNGVIKCAFTKNKANRGIFITGKDEDGNPIKVSALENPDFALTFDQWRNRDKVAPAPAKKTVAAMTKSVAKLTDVLLSGEFIGGYEELKGLRDALAALDSVSAKESAASVQRAADSLNDAYQAEQQKLDLQRQTLADSEAEKLAAEKVEADKVAAQANADTAQAATKPAPKKRAPAKKTA